MASVRSFHDVVFAIHPDDHEAEPGRVASLTKPQQPGAGHRLPGARSERPKFNLGGGPTRRNTDINGGGKAPKIPLVHCLGDFGANGREPSQRQL